ncbi:carbohydrate-binding protein [Spirosoma taeanense]|uniref:Carbohydrate-binding protein n=1 Tax=Spirosoma taeanense TaxID=2735870 RepID=A0A6M5YAR4_9BACT|nr:PQQ-dependent sugar dehydrogenase [Spirosoma taeanense]QJW90331.1 carbohydrate-binding protein [Spirosoma taeanense]
MNRRIRSFLSPVGSSLLLLVLMGWHTRKEDKLLIFLKNSTSQQAASVAAGALLNLVNQNGINADTTSSSAYIAEDSLKNYRAVVFLQTSPDVLDAWQQNDVERFVQAGGGLGIINAGGFTAYQWPWYNDMLANDPSRPADNRSSLFWSKPYDGGRVFYASAGNMADAALAKQILDGVKQSLEGQALDYRGAHTARTPEENRFTATVLDSYMEEPIEMEVMDDGRVLFIERRGNIKLYDPAAKATKIINKLPVHLTGNYEDGLLGLELDPKFEKNHFVYLYYSPVGSKPVQNLSRFTFTGDSLQMASEKIVMQVPVQRETCCHSAGNVYFGPDGYLYLSTGDNTSSKESDGFSPLDERPGRGPFDSQKSSGNTHDLRGKILRIQVENDGSYTIPNGNLFPKDGSQGRPEIYVMGARNPYRIWVDKRGFLYWGDVGPDGGVANERGPKSQDEWNQARKPGNYGWPYFVGDNKPYADFDFATNKVGPLFDPARPVNESPNNNGSKVLPPAQKAMIWYPYDKSAEFPMLGTGSRSAMAGPFYYLDDYKKSDVRFPTYYDKKMFIYEWARNWIKVLTFNEAGDLRQIEPFMPTTFISKPIDMKFGRDGAMYVLAYGANYFARNPDSQLLRIEYSEGNRRPVAKITASKTVGAVPLTARLSANESFDYDRGDKLTYQWESGNGQKSSAVNPAFTYTKPGIYRPKLTVIDAEGQRATTEVEIKVGNETPQIDIALKGNRSFYFDKTPLVYTVSVRDKEDGSLNKGILPRQVKFAVDYLAEGKDLALLTSNSQSLGDVGARFVQGRNLVANSDCKACHAMNAKSIGPTWMEVSKRYSPAGESAVPMLATKVITGGNGNWGKNVMSAHPQHTEAETSEMVRYILSLAAEGSQRLPLSGTYTPTQPSGASEEGSYVISASYTDKGNPVTGPLTGRKLIILRNPKVQAEAYTLSANVDRKHQDGSNQSWVGDIKDGSYIGFPDIDLTGITSLEFNVAAMPSRGGRIEVRAGSPTGKLLGSVNVGTPTEAGTGGGTGRRGPQWQTVTAPITNTSAPGDLFLVFRNEQVNDKNLMILDWLQFKK